MRGGGRVRREGTYVYLRLVHVDVRQRPTQYCESITLPFKKLNFLSKFFFNWGLGEGVPLLKEASLRLSPQARAGPVSPEPQEPGLLPQNLKSRACFPRTSRAGSVSPEPQEPGLFPQNLNISHVKVEVRVAQLRLTLCNPMDRAHLGSLFQPGD